MDARPIRELLADLVGDAEARHEYGADPAGYLAAHGHPDLPGDLVAEAVVSYADTAPVEVAAALAPYVAAHGPVPVPEVDTDPSWFDLLTTADAADNPFDEHLEAATATDADEDPTDLDFGAGADQEQPADLSPEPAMTDDADSVDEPAQDELPVEAAEAPFVPEAPIVGFDEDDDDNEADEPLD